MVWLKAPRPDMLSVSVEGKQYPVKNGMVEVQDNHVEALRPAGFVGRTTDEIVGDAVAADPVASKAAQDLTGGKRAPAPAAAEAEADPEPRAVRRRPQMPPTPSAA